MILCVAANPSVDRLFTVERLVPGEIHRPADFAQVPGGKGLNVARAAAALGGPVQAAALLGGHAGRWIAEALEGAGIDVHVAWAEAETRSSLSVAGALEEGLTEFYEHGFPVSAAEWRRFARLVGELAPRARLVTLSGTLPAGAPEDGYRELIGGTRTAFDSRSPGIDARPDVVKLNEEEAGLATGRPVESAENALAAARDLHAVSGGTAIVTRGEQGAVMLLPDGRAFEGVAPSAGRFPVGSGDAFLAGLVVALDRGAGWEDALRGGLGAGAANAEVPGAAVLDPARARTLAAAARVTRLV